VKGYRLDLLANDGGERIDGVTDFIGEDASGHFGIRAGHTRFITLLNVGLARFRCTTGPWQYLALPGALLYFEQGRMQISARHYLLDTDHARIGRLLRERMAAEERELGAAKQSLRRMEEELQRRLWEMRRSQ
jgi:F-type H+-transporting ATPase subunit epsilon